MAVDVSKVPRESRKHGRSGARVRGEREAAQTVRRSHRGSKKSPGKESEVALSE